MNEESIKEEFRTLFPEYKRNPNHWPIIDKFNYNLYKKDKFKMYDWIESKVDELINEDIKMKCRNNIKELSNINSVALGDKVKYPSLKIKQIIE